VIGATFLALIWIQVLRAQGLYKPLPATRKHIEARGIAVAGGVTTILHASIGHFFGIALFSPLFFLFFWSAIFVFDLLFRRMWAGFLGRLHLGDKNKKNIIIVGTNDSAWVYANQLKTDHSKSYNLLGFLDDVVVIAESRKEHLGLLNDFEELLNQYVVDEIVVAMPIRSCSSSIQKVIDYAHERGIAVRFPMLQIFSGITRNDIWRVRQEGTLGADGEFAHDLVVYSGHELGWRYFVKRSMDITVACVILALSSPLILFAAIGVFLGSGLPVIFVQDRYGYNGRIFKLYKFRTMNKNADAQQEKLRQKNQRDGAAFKMDNDPRVTKFGKLLRKTSIDELPQLINVIKGEMSIVGPRPLPLADYKRMNNSSHRRRLSVLPGITGPWQVSGRDHISFEEWMQMDLDYIDNWRLLTDIKIILMTVPTVLFARGSK
jgi:exopolysaccharide biosynthesis polyprenyl glycosylphosphotransferase